MLLNQRTKFNLDVASSAFAKENPVYLIPLNSVGNTRTSPPDLDTYQSKLSLE